jgi:hypothetical protein
MSTNGDGWKRYPRPVYTDPGQIDADIRNGTFARKTRAHAEAVEAWYAQVRPPLGVRRPVQVAA